MAGQALMFRRAGYSQHPVVLNGVAGVLSTVDGQPMSLLSFTVTDRKIVTIDVLADPERLRRLDLTFLD